MGVSHLGIELKLCADLLVQVGPKPLFPIGETDAASPGNHTVTSKGLHHTCPSGVTEGFIISLKPFLNLLEVIDTILIPKPTAPMAFIKHW